MRIISIDPGVMTGICYADIEDGDLTFYPFQATDDVHDMWRRLHQFNPRYIVIEDFEFRRGHYAGSGGGGLNLFPVQLIGIVRLYEFEGIEQTAVFLQKAAQGKSYYTNELLKQLGLYRRGVPHGMDAARHLLQWFTFGAGYQFNNRKPLEEVAHIADQLDWYK